MSWSRKFYKNLLFPLFVVSVGEYVRRKEILCLFSFFGVAALVLAGARVVLAQYTSDGEPFPISSPLHIVSPSNCTYSSDSLTFDVVVKSLLDSKNINLSYSLDGKDNGTLSLTATKEPVEVTRTYANGTVETVMYSSPFVPYTITGQAALTGLNEGTHNITVYAKYITNTVIGLDNSSVLFTIKTGAESQVLSSNSILESADNWSEVTRFSGKGSIVTTEPFTVDYVEWRIRWEIEPKSGFLSAYVYPDEPQSGWIDSIIRVPEDEETNGTQYIHDRNGTFYLEIMATQDTSYVLIVEQNVESIPEFSAWTVLPAVLSVTIVVVMLRKMLKNQKGEDNVE